MSTNKKVKHVLGLSGGKDSAALAIYMAREYPELDIDYFFTDTGYELPEVYDFIEKLPLFKPFYQPLPALKVEYHWFLAVFTTFWYFLNIHRER